MTAPSPKVEQRHREAALEVIGDDGSPARYALLEGIAAGRFDLNPAVQAFATFERDLLTPSGDAEGRAREALADAYRAEGFADKADKLISQDADWWYEAAAFRAIVAALTPPPALTEAAGLREALERAAEEYAYNPDSPRDENPNGNWLDPEAAFIAGAKWQTLAKSPPAAVGELTDRVRRLVIAARVAAYSDDDLDSRELDEAVEAFAADIPWENGDG